MMKIGIISEGHADRAVIVNILKGITGLEATSFDPLRPIYTKDETDKSLINPLTFSTWSEVKNECIKRELIDSFLAIEGQEFVVIHIDTDKAHEYGITRPDKKSENYCEEIRRLIIKEINEKWIKEDISDQLLYAIAVEEIDAWLLAIFEHADSSRYFNAKERLGRILSKKGVITTSNYDNYFMISKPLSKTKDINRHKFLDNNCNLKAFYEEVVEKVTPKLSKEDELLKGN